MPPKFAPSATDSSRARRSAVSMVRGLEQRPERGQHHRRRGDVGHPHGEEGHSGDDEQHDSRWLPRASRTTCLGTRPHPGHAATRRPPREAAHEAAGAPDPRTTRAPRTACRRAAAGRAARPFPRTAAGWGRRGGTSSVSHSVRHTPATATERPTIRSSTPSQPPRTLGADSEEGQGRSHPVLRASTRRGRWGVVAPGPPPGACGGGGWRSSVTLPEEGGR